MSTGEPVTFSPLKVTEMRSAEVSSSGEEGEEEEEEEDEEEEDEEEELSGTEEDGSAVPKESDVLSEEGREEDTAEEEDGTKREEAEEESGRDALSEEEAVASEIPPGSFSEAAPRWDGLPKRETPEEEDCPMSSSPLPYRTAAEVSGLAQLVGAASSSAAIKASALRDRRIQSSLPSVQGSRSSVFGPPPRSCSATIFLLYNKPSAISSERQL